MVSAARRQIIGGGGAPINKSRRRRSQIVGGGGAARPAHSSIPDQWPSHLFWDKSHTAYSLYMHVKEEIDHHSEHEIPPAVSMILEDSFVSAPHDE